MIPKANRLTSLSETVAVPASACPDCGAEISRLSGSHPEPNAGDLSIKNPIHHDESGWWFWDETWADRIGPFTTEEKARKALVAYGYWRIHGEIPISLNLHDVKPDAPSPESLELMREEAQFDRAAARRLADIEGGLD